MSEQLQREQSLQPLHERISNLAVEMGEAPEQRVEWLMHQTPESFGNILIGMNATARGVNPVEHDFDGEGVQAGMVAGSIPPDQEDKVVLLGELLTTTQDNAKKQIEAGETAETVMRETAMVIPVVINKLHLFADGNGRTSRIIRMVLRDGDQLTPEKIERVVTKSGIDKYDTTPAIPIDRALMLAMRQENETETIDIVHDATDDSMLVDEELDNLKSNYPTIDSSIVRAYEDGSNFNEALRLFAKDQGLDGEVSMKQLFDGMATDLEQQQKFIAAYRGVRKQKVELLMQGLLGTKEVPLMEATRESDINRWINLNRRRLGLPEINQDLIKTCCQLQMAYVETNSPQRNGGAE